MPGCWVRGEAAHGHQKQSPGFWQCHRGVIAAPPRKTSSWSPAGILCGAGTDVAHLGSAGPGGVLTSLSELQHESGAPLPTASCLAGSLGAEEETLGWIVKAGPRRSFPTAGGLAGAPAFARRVGASYL